MGIALGIILDDPRKASLLSALSGGPAPLQEAFRQRIARLADLIVAEPETAELGFDRATAIYVVTGSVQLTVAWLAGELGPDFDRDWLADRLAGLAVGAAGNRIR